VSFLTRIFQDDPRRRETGSSYSSQGSTKAPPSVVQEIGSSRGASIPEIVPQLASKQQALKIYEEMANGDPTVDVSLRAAKVPVLAANFFIQAFDDKPVNKDIAEFVNFNIFEGMTHSFVAVLEESLRMYDYGFSLLETVFETREWAPRRSGANRKKYTMLRKLAPRPATTIKEFVYDDTGGPVEVIQNAVRADNKIDEVRIPIDSLIVFTFNKKGGDLEGKSILRTAYQPWYYKKELYKIDAIGKERHAIGVPVMRILQPGYSNDDVKTAWKLVTNVRTNEKTGVVEPPNFEFRFEDLTGATVDVMPSIDHHDTKILLNVMAQFLLLGLQQGGGGGRATSGSHVDMFIKSLKYQANNICDAFNLWLIPKLVGYNFDTDEFPTMRVRNIGESKDTQMWASAVSNLLTSYAITPDIETEQWVREQLDMPYKEGKKQTPIDKTASDPNANGKGSVDPGHPNSGTGNRNTPPGFEEDA
jgi:hypothetical protein